MIGEFRPRLVPSLRSRVRSDGTVGLHDPKTGRAAELAADQALVFARVDGRRTVQQIAQAHLEERGVVPVAALRDLLIALAASGLLDNPPEELARGGFPPRTPRRRAGAAVLASAPLPASRAVTVAASLLAVWAALAWPLEPAPASGWDVLSAYAGASLALSARGLLTAAVAAVFGFPPERVFASVTLGVLCLGPDPAAAGLLDRRPRVLAQAAGLAGSAAAALYCAGRPGLLAGALAVFVLDSCPFAATSMGRFLAALAGRVDLREHARAYATRRMLRRAASREFFAGEGSLIVTALASLAWLCAAVRLVFTNGALAALDLFSRGLDGDGAEAALALGGAVGLMALMPASLVALLAALARAIAALVPRRERPAAVDGRSPQAADLASVPLLARLSEPELASLAGAARSVRHPAGSTIVRQGDPADAFYLIRSGRATVEVESESGWGTEVARLGPGDGFGETALLEGGRRTATVRALTEVEVASVTAGAFEAVRRAWGDGELVRVLRATAALGRSRFFSQLPADRRTALAVHLRPRAVAAGESVVRAGEPGEEFFLVADGGLEVVDERGRRVAELGPGDHFGEIAILSGHRRTATVRAVRASEVLALSREDFAAALAADLAVSARVEELAAARAGGVR